MTGYRGTPDDRLYGWLAVLLAAGAVTIVFATIWGIVHAVRN